MNHFLPVLYAQVCRIRLNCDAVKNSLLSDQALEAYGYNAESFKAALQARANRVPDHKYTDALKALLTRFQDRRTLNIKDVRNIVVAELGSNKPREVLLVQLIAANVAIANTNQDSVQSYLGPKAVARLVG